jgi:hypothetical protein
MKTVALIMTLLVSATVSAQETTTGYAPVNGLEMYYEMDGKGDPVVLLHRAFMTHHHQLAGHDRAAFKKPAREITVCQLQTAVAALVQA